MYQGPSPMKKEIKMNSSLKITKQLFALLLTLGILSSGCIKDEDFNYDKVAATNWDPDIAIPLINSSLGINDLTGFSNSTIVDIDSNNLVHLLYQGNVYSVYGYQFMPMLSQSNIQIFNLNQTDSANLYQSGTVTRTYSIIFPFAVTSGEQLDSVLLREGFLDISVQSQIPHSGSVTIDIPEAQLNGVPFSRNVPFNYAGGLPVLSANSDDLAGYKLNFRGSGSFNQLRINYTLTFNNSTTSLPCTFRNFYLTCDFNNLRMANAFGYFGQKPLLITEDSSKIELFNNSIFGNIAFDNPKITFDISNSFGMPIYAQMTSLYSISNTGATTAITGAIPDPLPVNTPSVLGETALGSFYLDKSNSNIASVLNQNPRYIAYNVNATSNSPTPAYNFVSDSSLFKVDIEVDLPLFGTAEGFTVQDTADFNLENIEEIQKATFRINATNGFPANAYVQVYFADSAFAILDSLLSNPSDFIIESGLLDVNGKVILPNTNTRDEIFDKSRLNKIFQAKKLIILGIINTQNAPVQMVPIYSSYRLDIKVGVRAIANLEF